MTMMSFRLDEAETNRAQLWADRLRVDRSELFRTAIRQYLDRLASEDDGRIWESRPLDGGERSVSVIADWSFAEDWSDWTDAAG